MRVGFIRAKQPLEGTTDKFVCEVEVAPGDVRSIVAASAHPLEVGWGVPVALAGTDLPTGDSIHEEHFHGVLSQGMICLDGEMGMIATGSGLAGVSRRIAAGQEPSRGDADRRGAGSHEGVSQPAGLFGAGRNRAGTRRAARFETGAAGGAATGFFQRRRDAGEDSGPRGVHALHVPGDLWSARRKIVTHGWRAACWRRDRVRSTMSSTSRTS